MSTISSAITHSITLSTSGTYTSPLTITQSGSISNSGTGDAIFGPGTSVWTIDNAGMVAATGTFDAVDLRAGGYVGNSGAISISNSGTTNAYGIYIGGTTGVVTNSGLITATGTSAHNSGIFVATDGAVTNLGTINADWAGVQIDPLGDSRAIFSTAVNSGTITAAYMGIRIAKGSVANSGTIAAVKFTNSEGIFLGIGGTVTNSGAITASQDGIDIRSSSFISTAVNSGTITGNTGIGLFGAGTIIDSGMISARFAGIVISQRSYPDAYVSITSGGVVSGVPGVEIEGYLPAKIANAGSIGGGVDLDLYAGQTALGVADTLVNTGRITGDTGVSVNNEATIINSGVVIGTAGSGISAYDFQDGGSETIIDSGTITGSTKGITFGGRDYPANRNLLGLERGYSIAGGVEGAVYGTNTLELMGSVGGSLTVNYNSLGLTNFQDVLFGSGGYDTLRIANTSGTLPLTVSGFTLTSDVIDFASIGSNGTITNFDSVNHRLTIAGSLGTVTLQLDASDGTVFSTASDGATGTDLVPCFCRGTRILTETGEVAVEDLLIGDRAMTRSGAARPIKWIGRRSYDGRFIRGNVHVQPIRVAAGALGDGVPHCDLWLSPGHALCLGGALVKAEQLLNGMTVRQYADVDRVEYFHIELDSHDILLAEGAPAESYIDCDNRGQFHNVEEFACLYPEDDRPHWAYSCPEVSEQELKALRERLLARAPLCGWSLSPDPGLYLLADGQPVRPERIAGENYTFRLAGRPRNLRILSRSAVPREVGINQDTRRLGAKLRRITVRSPGLCLEVGFDEPSLVEGFHEAEDTHRWTDGDALLPARFLDCVTGAIEIEIVSGALAHYPIAAPSAPAAAAG